MAAHVEQKDRLNLGPFHAFTPLDVPITLACEQASLHPPNMERKACVESEEINDFPMRHHRRFCSEDRQILKVSEGG